MEIRAINSLSFLGIDFSWKFDRNVDCHPCLKPWPLEIVREPSARLAPIYTCFPVFIGRWSYIVASRNSQSELNSSNQLYLDSNRRYTIGIITGDVKIPCPFAPFLLLLWILFVHLWHQRFQCGSASPKLCPLELGDTDTVFCFAVLCVLWYILFQNYHVLNPSVDSQHMLVY